MTRVAIGTPAQCGPAITPGSTAGRPEGAGLLPAPVRGRPPGGGVHERLHPATRHSAPPMPWNRSARRRHSMPCGGGERTAVLRCRAPARTATAAASAPRRHQGRTRGSRGGASASSGAAWTSWPVPVHGVTTGEAHRAHGTRRLAGTRVSAPRPARTWRPRPARGRHPPAAVPRAIEGGRGRRRRTRWGPGSNRAAGRPPAAPARPRRARPYGVEVAAAGEAETPMVRPAPETGCGRPSGRPGTITAPHHAVPHRTTPRHAVPRHATPYRATPYRATPRRAAPRRGHRAGGTAPWPPSTPASPRSPRAPSPAPPVPASPALCRAPPRRGRWPAALSVSLTPRAARPEPPGPDRRCAPAGRGPARPRRGRVRRRHPVARAPRAA